MPAYEAKIKWIPIEEVLPELGEPVWTWVVNIFGKGKMWRSALHRKDPIAWMILDQETFADRLRMQVTHWAVIEGPKPEPVFNEARGDLGFKHR